MPLPSPSRSRRLPLSVLPAGLALLLPACGGGGGGGGSSAVLSIVEVSNGFGKLLPHQIAELNPTTGLPTSQVVELTRYDQLVANASLTNPIKPPTEWPVLAVLPNGKPGNHFLVARFTQALDPTSVLSQDETGALAPGVEVRSVNPNSGEFLQIHGRAFVAGRTFGPTLNASGDRALVAWVEEDSSDAGEELDVVLAEGFGFPGTEPLSDFVGADDLLRPDTLVFVVDEDGDLATHETFPTGRSIQMRIGPTVRSTRGRSLKDVGLAAATVGPDTFPPEVLVAGPDQAPVMTPAKGEQDVDPQANVIIEFTEPVQLMTVGDLDDGTPPFVSTAVQLTFGPSQARTTVPFTVRPISMFDLTRFELATVFDFPGSGPAVPGVQCENVFGQVDVVINVAQFRDLSIHGSQGLGNLNTQPRQSFFITREGPGIVNSPVTPDAIYIGRTGSNQGISVIDLNGFGAGTGNPLYEITEPIKQGNSNYPNNPNVALQGAQLIPPLTPGTCTFNGGSPGAFTLVRDSSLRDMVAGAPQLESVGDMALGHALDNTFNNEQPFGCQSGGGNICASSGLKLIRIISGGPNTVASANIAPVAPLKVDSGVENLVSWAPHPNPPPLIFPPLCLSPLINGQEPTSINTTCLPVGPPQGCFGSYGPPFSPASGGPTLNNLLVPGPFPLGEPSIGLPPQSTLASELNSFFEGPTPPQPTLGACQPYMMRQQIGHFLYVIDRVASEVVVFNSNRFTVLDRIRLLDPTSLAISPNLDFLAVTNEGADQVSFIDIDPSSATFHQIIKTTTVGTGPTGICWESSNEDILVCNQGEGTVSVISGFTLDVRKTLRNQITRPIDVALTPRQTVFGFARGVYFGYILNQNGTVAVFESGPDGINGIGFDDVITTLPFRFQRPKTLQADPTNLNSAIWIVHENPLDVAGNDSGQGGGAVSNVGITGGLPGPIPLDPGIFLGPQVRELEFGVLASFGEGAIGLSGIPVDVAFDDMRNLSALTNYGTTFSPGNNLSYNGKSLVRLLGAGALQANSPQFMFIAVPNPGVIDVFDMTSGAFERVDTNVFDDGTQSIQAPNAAVLMDYFRQ